MFNLYKDSLEEVIDSNIDDGVLGKNNSLQPLKLRVSAL